MGVEIPTPDKGYRLEHGEVLCPFCGDPEREADMYHCTWCNGTCCFACRSGPSHQLRCPDCQQSAEESSCA